MENEKKSAPEVTSSVKETVALEAKLITQIAEVDPILEE